MERPSRVVAFSPAQVAVANAVLQDRVSVVAWGPAGTGKSLIADFCQKVNPDVHVRLYDESGDKQPPAGVPVIWMGNTAPPADVAAQATHVIKFATRTADTSAGTDSCTTLATT